MNEWFSLNDFVSLFSLDLVGAHSAALSFDDRKRPVEGRDSSTLRTCDSKMSRPPVPDLVSPGVVLPQGGGNVPERGKSSPPSFQLLPHHQSLLMSLSLH